MEKENNTLEKAIKQAVASIWMDKLPLSKEYVAKYYERRLIEKKAQSLEPKLTLKRGGKNGK